jgi:hypothetical protein
LDGLSQAGRLGGGLVVRDCQRPMTALAAGGLRAWRRPVVRRAAAVGSLLAAAYVQYLFGNFHGPTRTRPLTAKAGTDWIVLGQVRPKGSDPQLLAISSLPAMVARTYATVLFERAQLDAESVKLWQAIGLKPDTTLGKIRFSPDDADQPQNGGCGTAVEIRAGAAVPLTGLQIRPLADVASDARLRAIEFRSREALRIRLLPASGEDRQTTGPACKMSLVGDQWQQEIPAGFPVAVLSAPGAAVRFQFQALRLPAGVDLDKAALEIAPLEVSDAAVKSASGTLYSARVRRQDPPLSLTNLVLGSEQVQLSSEGRALVEEDGKAVTRNLFEWAKDEPILAALYAMINAALAGWVLTAFRGQERSKAAAA